MILECLHEVFGKVGPVLFWVAVPLDLTEFFEQEPVVVFCGDGEGLAVEPCGGPCEGAQELPAVAVVVFGSVGIEVLPDVL